VGVQRQDCGYHINPAREPIAGYNGLLEGDRNDRAERVAQPSA